MGVTCHHFHRMFLGTQISLLNMGRGGARRGLRSHLGDASHRCPVTHSSSRGRGDVMGHVDGSVTFCKSFLASTGTMVSGGLNPATPFPQTPLPFPSSMPVVSLALYLRNACSDTE